MGGGEIADAGGSSTLWRAQLVSAAEQRRLVEHLARMRAAEYVTIRSGRRRRGIAGGTSPGCALAAGGASPGAPSGLLPAGGA